jgi:hypothetical protein
MPPFDCRDENVIILEHAKFLCLTISGFGSMEIDDPNCGATT